MKDGVGPRVPLMNVEGEVHRDGAPAARLSVSVRNPSDSRSVASARTGDDGAYAVAAPTGAWEIRVSGGETGDFDSVTREFTLASPDERLTIPSIDVSAMGAAAVAPADSAEWSMPSSDDPVRFSWTAPSTPVRSARVQVYDQAGAAVWYADKTTATSQTWDGFGNQGAYAGHAAPAGSYLWRVKFQFPDSAEARLAYRSLLLQ
jgi:hypothetical protein